MPGTSLRFLAILVLIAFFVSSCGTINRTLDPYYGDMPCERKAGKEMPCRSVEEVYSTVFDEELEVNDWDYQSEYEPARKKKKGISWKKTALGAAIGAGIGAGIGAMTVKEHDKLVERSLPGGGKFYEVVKEDGDKLAAALIGAAIGLGAGGVLAFLIQKAFEAHGKIDSEMLASMQEKAKSYEKCIRDAANLEKEKGPRAAADAAEKCGAILAGLPGVTFISSKQISALVKLQHDNQKTIKKILSRDVLNRDQELYPLHTPPTIVRVTVTPWVDSEGVFHQGETLYVKVDEGRWVLPSPKKKEGKQIINPLKEAQ